MSPRNRLLTICYLIAAVVVCRQAIARELPFQNPGWVVPTSACSSVSTARVRLDLYGSVDLVSPDVKTTHFLFSNSQHPDFLDLPVSSLPFARHQAWLIYPTGDEVYKSPDLVGMALSATGWSYVDMSGWHVTVGIASGTPGLRMDRSPVAGSLPTMNDRCSLNWLPWLDDLTTSWPTGAGDFEATTLQPSLPGGTKRLLTSRLVLSPPNEADVFAGSFHSADGGAKPCDASLGSQARALPKSIAVVFPVAAAQYDILFRDIGDENAAPVKLTLTAPASGEQQIYVSHHPHADSRNDFMLHYGLRENPPTGSAYYLLPCFQGPLPVPTCCKDPSPNDNPQCSPAQHDYP
jgi:hypothetical protein